MLVDNILNDGDAKLYDVCIAIDSVEGSLKQIAERLFVTVRTVERKIKRLNYLGIKVRINRKDKDKNTDYNYSLEDCVEEALLKLDKSFGVRPYPKSSSLPKEEQEKVLDTYKKLLNGEISHWPYYFFDDVETRDEKIRVIIPFSIENVIKRELKDVCYKNLAKAKLNVVCNKYYGASPFLFLKTSYIWLKEWELGKIKGIWKGKKGKQLMKETIKWLIEDVLHYSLDEVPQRIRVKDFRDNNLGGLIQQPLFRLSPYKVLGFAYPGRFRKAQFTYAKKWGGKRGLNRAAKVTRNIIENKLGINLEEIPKKLTRNKFHQALREKGISGLQHVFGMRLYEIVDNAYPGKFQRRDFTRAFSWKNDRNKETAAREVRYFIEEKKKWEVEDILKKINQEVLVENGFSGMLTSKFLGFKGSIFAAINNAYPGKFKEWQFKGTRKWKGEKGRKLAREAIKWLVEERYGWSQEELPRKIRVYHFRQNGLSGLLASDDLGLRNSPYLAINFTYPGKYFKKDFPTCKRV